MRVHQAFVLICLLFFLLSRINFFVARSQQDKSNFESSVSNVTSSAALIESCVSNVTSSKRVLSRIYVTRDQLEIVLV
jgi:hypothetical protein